MTESLGTAAFETWENAEGATVTVIIVVLLDGTPDVCDGTTDDGVPSEADEPEADEMLLAEKSKKKR